jgi:predicted ATP-binding protein involved in virulence
MVPSAFGGNPHMGREVLERTVGIVAIDELDLHLHPKWQRRIISDLKRTFRRIQFVATTHSPQMIGEALPDEIRLLENWSVFTPGYSFGVDSNRILQELMHTSSRNEKTQQLLSELAEKMDSEDMDSAKKLVARLIEELGEGDLLAQEADCAVAVEGSCSGRQICPMNLAEVRVAS